MLNLFDSHTHSDNSPDGTHSVTFMCEKAVEKGLMGIAVTDHCEIDKFKADNYHLRMIQSAFEVRKAQLYFGDRLMLTAGIELGQPLFDKELAGKALELHNYDVVLLSVHQPRGGEDYYYIDYKAKSKKEIGELLTVYFDEVLASLRWGGYDVCAHLTYPLRYITERDGVEVDLSRFAPVIDEILKTVADAGKALEINTSGLAGGGDFLPGKRILCRFKELGGEIVTLGSDAHSAENLGQGVEAGMELLKDCGYKYFAFYKKRKPRMLDIM